MDNPPQPQNIHYLPTTYQASLPPPAEPYDNHRSAHTPIVIDNGSTNLRWGFGTSSTPFSGPNAIAKYKERKTNKPLLLFGEGIDSESGARGQAKTPWEGDILLNFDALENALDYAFIQLGIDTPTVDHPILMTERLCSPLHSRALTSELMFELYSVPSLTYCVDGLMSFYQNHLPPPDKPYSANCLVVSFNTASTSVIPVYRGKGLLNHAKRIPWGASQSSEYLLQLIQLKYPTFPTRITNIQTNWILHNFCSVASDFPALLKKLQNPLNLRASEVVIQFPFTLPVVEEKTEEELARIAEKRKEQGRKLQEMAAKTRMEKLLKKESDLQYLTALKEGRGGESKKEWTGKLQAEGIESEAALDDIIKKLDNDLKKARRKEAGETEEPLEEPSFPLVDVPDADLDEESLKEKKKQKLMKAGFEARVRARKEKEREREEKEREEKREEEEREEDLDGWAKRLRREQEALMSKIKDRARRKAALNDRKSAAAQARMKNIASLAADDRVPKAKKRKIGGEDMFGADDADWAIYRKINTAAPSDDEEDDLAALHTIEQKLLAYDPTFTPSHTHAALASQRSALVSAFRPVYDEADVQGNTRIHLSTELTRVCEAWFAPGMAGVDSAGLGEVIANMVPSFVPSLSASSFRSSSSNTFSSSHPHTSSTDRSSVLSNVLLTGLPSLIPGMPERLHSILQSVLPPGTPIRVRRAQDAGMDAWKGMAAFSRSREYTTTPGRERYSVSKAEYEEWGGERVKIWWGGNWNGGVNVSSPGEDDEDGWGGGGDEGGGHGGDWDGDAMEGVEETGDGHGGDGGGGGSSGGGAPAPGPGPAPSRDLGKAAEAGPSSSSASTSAPVAGPSTSTSEPVAGPSTSAAADGPPPTKQEIENAPHVEAMFRKMFPMPGDILGDNSDGEPDGNGYESTYYEPDPEDEW
ncbi:actin-like ATPase domain-containing protein [Agrocybe pediades]|nr:actin-like ATPase domain-containing protein [Agrocybe pediades]